MHSPWHIPEPNPDPRKPTILVYSSCHVHGILRYLNEHRPEVRAKYNVSAILIHVAAEDPDARTSPRFIHAFAQADFILHHPLASAKWSGMRVEDAPIKPSCVCVTMESPQASCFWPIVEGHDPGESPVIELLNIGSAFSGVLSRFDSGSMEPYFATRFEWDMARMRIREADSDLKSAHFIKAHFRKTKMFFTENHPTMPVLAWMTDQFLNKLGHPLLGHEHALSLPLDTMPGENHFPETEYEWRNYALEYPRRYEHNMGGPKHYHEIIERICTKHGKSTRTAP